MRKLLNHLVVFMICCPTVQQAVSQQLTATEIIRRADEKFNGEKTSQGEMSVQIVRPSWERTIVCKYWAKGRDYSLTLVTSPAREKGHSFLKLKNELWTWNPTISRLIKLPPSMLSQGWMNSDYSNDDILKESSLLLDYSHQMAGEGLHEGTACWKILLIPKDNAAVVWGKIIKWISKDEFLMLKSEYFDEDGVLVKTESAYDIRMMDDRRLPTRIEIIPAKEKGNKTIVRMLSVKFNRDLGDAFFSQQNMKTVK